MSAKARLMGICFAAALTVCAALATASSAFGDYHLIKIKEISGSSGHNRASYIELQMYGPGQTQLAGHDITIWNNVAFIAQMPAPIGTFTLAGANPTNGENQRTILIGDNNVPNADFTIPGLDTFLDTNSIGNVVNAGALCFEATPIDCVSWGGENFQGQTRIPDHAEPHFAALPIDFSLRRRIDRRGCATSLDPADDTNNNAVDFVQGLREPTPNSVTPVERPCPTARCAGTQATTIGTPAANTLFGTPRKDVIAGLGGNDTIRGLGGNDVLCGNGGRDRLIGGDGRDRLLGGPGRDRLLGGPGRDILRGGAGKDVLRGGPGRDKQIQ